MVSQLYFTTDLYELLFFLSCVALNSIIHPPEIMIAMLEVRACAVDAEIIEGSENNSLFEDIGIYKFDLLVDSPSSGIGGEGQHYAPAKIFDIIVEIIK